MFRIIIVIGLLALTAACAKPAYVYKPGEFNRNSSNFGKDVTDIKTVTVCYSSRGATPTQVRALAESECAKFGKTAQFKNQDYAVCPLPTPVSAHFSCLGGGIDAPAAKAAKETGGGNNQIDYDGILFSY